MNSLSEFATGVIEKLEEWCVLEAGQSLVITCTNEEGDYTFHIEGEEETLQ